VRIDDSPGQELGCSTSQAVRCNDDEDRRADLVSSDSVFLIVLDVTIRDHYVLRPAIATLDENCQPNLAADAVAS
jgi:hypothetical protein